MGQEKTPEQIAQEKLQLRAKLRNEYWKQVTNPHRHGTGEGGHVFDTSVQRYLSSRASQYDYFKPNWLTGKKAILMMVVPMAVFYFAMKEERDTKEHKIRTGQIAYRDRQFKYI